MNIGFIGKFGSGKTSAANHLVDNYGFKCISLATPIKDIMNEYLNIKDKTHPDYRKMAQKIGTDWFRSEYPDIWVDYMIKQANKSKSHLVCDDIRFINEAKKLLENNWILFYLICPEEIRIERCKRRDGTFDYNTLNHLSETGVDDILKTFRIGIHKIDASGTIEDTNAILDICMDILSKIQKEY